MGEPDYTVIQASANAPTFLSLDGQIIGQKLEDIPGNLSRTNQASSEFSRSRTIPIAVRCRIGAPGRDYDGLLHRPPEGGLIIELEPAGPPVDLSRHVETAVQTILGAASLRTLCDEVARIFEELTGYDRVMVYRFDEEGHGEVFSEQRKPDLEAISATGTRLPTFRKSHDDYMSAIASVFWWTWNTSGAADAPAIAIDRARSRYVALLPA